VTLGRQRAKRDRVHIEEEDAPLGVEDIDVLRDAS
jgi:hypothetical protein